MLTGPVKPVRVHHPHQRLDDVVDVGERPGLLAVAVDRQFLAAQRRDAEVGNHAAVVDRHPRPVGVEDAHDADVDVVLPMVVHHQAFGDALAFVVAGAHADRIDVAPVALGLRMLLGIAVDLAGRGQQDARAHALGQPQHVDRAHHAGLDGLDRIVLVVHRRGRAGEMKDAIDFEQDRLDDVVADEFEVADGRCRCRMLARLPLKKLSRQMTSCPSRSSRSHRCDPRNPAPPVTSTRTSRPPSRSS